MTTPPASGAPQVSSTPPRRIERELTGKRGRRASSWALRAAYLTPIFTPCQESWALAEKLGIPVPNFCAWWSERHYW
jgi:hypothetical protein